MREWRLNLLIFSNNKSIERLSIVHYFTGTLREKRDTFVVHFRKEHADTSTFLIFTTHANDITKDSTMGLLRS